MLTGHVGGKVGKWNFMSKVAHFSRVKNSLKKTVESTKEEWGGVSLVHENTKLAHRYSSQSGRIMKCRSVIQGA